jgi:hypothetical protein
MINIRFKELGYDIIKDRDKFLEVSSQLKDFARAHIY